MKEVQNFIVWQAKPVFEKLFVGSENCTLRYAAKKNLPMLEPLFEDILESLVGDKEEHESEPSANGFPSTADSFYTRFPPLISKSTVTTKTFPLH